MKTMIYDIVGGVADVDVVVVVVVAAVVGVA